jgi:hypothetical protein
VNLASQPDLALWLFAPWFVILAVLYWLYPRQPRHAARRWFDAIALLVALVAFVLTLHWSHGYADRHYGALWPQILATVVGYGAFLAVLVIAIAVRRRWLHRRR